VNFLLGGAFFALAAYVGILLAGTVHLPAPLEDGPEPHEPPTRWILLGAALAGAFITAHAGSGAQLALLALVIAALSAVWCTDARYGIVPDVFTLLPLALIIGIALFQKQPLLLASAAIPFLPFAAAAALSKGRGMGWGDVKLAALGGAVLGAQIALLAFGLCCVAAVVYARVKGRSGEPIAFAPFMAAAITAAIPFGMLG
jgi:prepilin signal peptidase PulO-like enzyme (type II secretory pathway)